MKEGWEYKRLEEICTPINGLWKGKKEPFVNVGVIRNANFKKDFTLDFSNIEYLDVEAKKFASRKLEPGDLIVERSGGSEKQPVGRAVLFNQSEGDYSFSNFTSVIRINDRKQVSPIFLFKYLLYFYLKGETRPMQNAAIGLHNLDFKRYLSIEVPVPPLSEQQRIVSYLDAAFAKINAVAKNAEDSLNEAKALFQSALAKMMEPKEGWEEKNLVEELKLKSGEYLPSKEHAGGSIPVYGGNGITGHHNESNLDGEHIIIGRVGALCGNVHLTNGKIWVTDNAFVATGLDETWDKKFLMYELTSIDLNKYATKAVQPVISNKSLREVSLYKPSLDVQNDITKTLENVENNINSLSSNLSRTLTECAALKQSILRQTFE